MIASKLSSLRRIIHERHERWLAGSGKTSQPIASTSSLASSASFETPTDVFSLASTSSDQSGPARKKLERASTTLDLPKKESLVQRLKRTLGKSKEKSKVKEEKLEKPEDWTVVDTTNEPSEKSDPLSRTSTGILYARSALTSLRFSASIDRPRTVLQRRVQPGKRISLRSPAPDRKPRSTQRSQPPTLSLSHPSILPCRRNTPIHFDLVSVRP